MRDERTVCEVVGGTVIGAVASTAGAGGDRRRDWTRPVMRREDARGALSSGGFVFVDDTTMS